MEKRKGYEWESRWSAHTVENHDWAKTTSRTTLAVRRNVGKRGRPSLLWFSRIEEYHPVTGFFELLRPQVATDVCSTALSHSIVDGVRANFGDVDDMLRGQTSPALALSIAFGKRFYSSPHVVIMPTDVVVS